MSLLLFGPQIFFRRFEKGASNEYPQQMFSLRNKIIVVAPFVCVEVLRPSQPNGVMSSAVSLPNHTFTGQA